MDQKDGHGHHAITKAAVDELFADLPEDGTIRGMTREQYEESLDAGQEHQDRWYGPTTHPAWADGDAQREHGMADPDLTGEENRIVDREYVEDELVAARGDNAMAHLGNAAHALEDSYSEAHAFRGDAANSGDPTAPIESFNVFDPLPNPAMGTWGKFLDDEQGTHDERFDSVPLDEDGNLVRGTDVAGAHAVADMLKAYESNIGNPDAVANANVDAVVDQFYRAPEGGETAVNDEASEEWRAERDERLEVHREELEDAGVEPEKGFIDGLVDDVTAVAVTVGTGLATAGEWAVDEGGKAVDWTGEQAVAAGEAIGDAGEWAGEQAVAAGEAIGDAGEWAGEQAVAAGEAIGDAGEWAGEKAEAAGEAISEGLDDGVEAVEEFFEDVL